MRKRDVEPQAARQVNSATRIACVCVCGKDTVCVGMSISYFLLIFVMHACVRAFIRTRNIIQSAKNALEHALVGLGKGPVASSDGNLRSVRMVGAGG